MCSKETVTLLIHKGMTHDVCVNMDYSAKRECKQLFFILPYCLNLQHISCMMNETRRNHTYTTIMSHIASKKCLLIVAIPHLQRKSSENISFHLLNQRHQTIFQFLECITECWELSTRKIIDDLSRFIKYWFNILIEFLHKILLEFIQSNNESQKIYSCVINHLC